MEMVQEQFDEFNRIMSRRGLRICKKKEKREVMLVGREKEQEADIR